MTTGRSIYFAYGSNLCIAQMKRRCPAAITMGSACLSGWRFVINRNGLATIAPDGDAVVWGGLWSLTPRCERTLDAYEAITSGLYSRTNLSVEAEHGLSIEALVYVATDEEPGRASHGYLSAITEGARDFGLPQSYVGWLERHALPVWS